jgi:hypothetical protein
MQREGESPSTICARRAPSPEAETLAGLSGHERPNPSRSLTYGR